MKPFVISTRSTQSFDELVQKALHSGYSMDTEPFVMGGSLLCQWMKPTPNYYEWKLVVGISTFDVQAEVQRLCGEGFDFLWNYMRFDQENVFVQWVCRWKQVPVPLTVQAEQKLLDGVRKEFQLVEDVQPVKLVADEGLLSSWRNPFVVN